MARNEDIVLTKQAQEQLGLTPQVLRSIAEQGLGRSQPTKEDGLLTKAGVFIGKLIEKYDWRPFVIADPREAIVIERTTLGGNLQFRQATGLFSRETLEEQSKNLEKYEEEVLIGKREDGSPLVHPQRFHFKIPALETAYGYNVVTRRTIEFIPPNEVEVPGFQANMKVKVTAGERVLAPLVVHANYESLPNAEGYLYGALAPKAIQRGINSPQYKAVMEPLINKPTDPDSPVVNFSLLDEFTTVLNRAVGAGLSRGGRRRAGLEIVDVNIDPIISEKLAAAFDAPVRALDARVQAMGESAGLEYKVRAVVNGIFSDPTIRGAITRLTGGPTNKEDVVKEVMGDPDMLTAVLGISLNDDQVMDQILTDPQIKSKIIAKLTKPKS